MALRIRSSLLALMLTSGAIAAPLSPSLRSDIREAARVAELDPRLVEAVVEAESNFDPQATSKKGAKGLMQVIDPTAEICGIQNSYHVLNNLMGACRCLRQLINRYSGDLSKALAAYNAGAGAVDRYGGIPPYRETRNYVKRIVRRYRELKVHRQPR